MERIKLYKNFKKIKLKLYDTPYTKLNYAPGFILLKLFS